MQDTLNKNIKKLTSLIKQSQNKKLLWEEMQLISQKAFALQDAIMAELDEIEALEKDIVKVQAAFTARETIWNLMTQITDRELELKEKTHHKETPAEREKRHKEVMEQAHEVHHCCCGHHHHDECCDHHHKKNCTHHNCSDKGRKTCKKK